MKPQIAKAFVVYDGKILLLTRSLDRRHRPGDYDLPGGTVDTGETVLAGLARELEEEAGLVINSSDAVEVNVPGLESNDPGIEKHVFVVALKGHARPQIVLSDEHMSYEWLGPNEIVARFSHAYYVPALQYAVKAGML